MKREDGVTVSGSGEVRELQKRHSNNLMNERSGDLYGHGDWYWMIGCTGGNRKVPLGGQKCDWEDEGRKYPRC